MNWFWILFEDPITIGGRSCQVLRWEDRDYYGLEKLTFLHSAIDREFWAIEIISKDFITKKKQILTVPKSAILMIKD